MIVSCVLEELFYLFDDDKMCLLLMFIEEEWLDKVIVFVNIKYSCECVVDWLEVDGYCVGLLSGDVF